VSVFGGVVALTRPVDRATAERLVSIFLEIVVAPAFDPDALEILATKPNLRVLLDEALADDAVPSAPPDPTGSIRTAGGAVLVTTPDVSADDPTTWTCATRRAPTDPELLDLDLAWRLVRGVTSNAIVLVRDRRLVGMGSGQTSRVDAARQAVAKAHAMLGPAATEGAACGSDAFFPFPDAVEVCLAAGVTAFAQPGGSLHDADAVAAVDAAGGTMLMTGLRHFRH
jgi:phosphoribosylaminoimidazolecarboxamide formyltransferase/IMP cyclohydrolase